MIYLNVRFRITSRYLLRSRRSFSSKEGESPGAAGAASYALSEKLEHERGPYTSSMSTILSHAGLSMHASIVEGHRDNRPLSPPIELATTYERPPDGKYRENDWIYSRQRNPTRKLLEDIMGKLETAKIDRDTLNIDDYDKSCMAAMGFAFSSGMAAIASLLLAHKTPVKVLIPTDVYHGLPTQFALTLNNHGVLHQTVDMTNIEHLNGIISKNIENASGSEGSLIVWMETPSNPLCQITDIKEICKMVDGIRSAQGSDRFRITTVVDSTWAPPCITQPLKLGADIVVHSGTKYLGGHSDVLLGIICTSPFTGQGKWLHEHVAAVQTSVGAVPSPFECWLTLRGLRTLHLRVEQSSRSAYQIAKYLEKHKDVNKCHYPGLATHPEHGIATRQMNNNLYGGMLSFEVNDERKAMAVAGAVKIIRRATSLGGTETLIEHRASIEPPERRTSPPGLLRLSVGLENVEDLLFDLERALDTAAKVCKN